MKIFVFSGPTLAAAEGRKIVDATFLPPVAQGDVYRAGLQRPSAIGIIDGYFERLPAVWHKEILWAMSKGIRVYGAASMGALRAAELEAYGMVGVGAIYEAFRRGELEDDDEVALTHGEAESGYLRLSEAMVDIRATLTAAERAGVIDPPVRRRLENVAKGLFYPRRAYPEILGIAEREGMPGADLAALRDWLPGGRVDQKREDAEAMLRVMSDAAERGQGRQRVRYHFEHTAIWDQVLRRAGRRSLSLPSPERQSELLLDELRLAGLEAYAGAVQGAQRRALAIEVSEAQVGATPELVQQAADDFRRRRRLYRPSEVESWMAEQHLDKEGFDRMMEAESRLAWVDTIYRADAALQLPDHLRSEGIYGRLQRRSRDKQLRLEEAGLFDAGVDQTRIRRDDLLRWHFDEQLGRSVPADLGRYSRALGLADERELLQMLAREYLYRGLASATEQGSGDRTGVSGRASGDA